MLVKVFNGWVYEEFYHSAFSYLSCQGKYGQKGIDGGNYGKQLLSGCYNTAYCVNIYYIYESVHWGDYLLFLMAESCLIYLRFAHNLSKPR
jgi:hypothetical protein